MAQKILVLDENSTRKTNFASRLRTQNFDTVLATGGFHALHLLEKESFAMIVIFDNMNDMSGEEILGLIRTKVPKDKLPVIYVSKNPDQAAILQLFEHGANDFVTYTPNFFGPCLEKIKKLIPVS